VPPVASAITFDDRGDHLPAARSVREAGFIDTAACPASAQLQRASIDQGVPLAILVDGPVALPLKGDTLLTEKRPESLVADVLNHPLFAPGGRPAW
jgi:hypothetical protein